MTTSRHAEAAPGAPAAPRVGAPPRETVLLVEDDDQVRSVTGRLLSASGYHVLEVTKPSEALAVCESEQGPIHLLVTDVVMAGMSGIELAKRVRRLQPSIAILFVSGHAEELTTGRSELSQLGHFLAKPFDRTSLLDAVRRALEK